MMLTTEEIYYKVIGRLTWKGNLAKVKNNTKEYEKGISYSKKEMSKYEGVNILRNEKLKKWSILITPYI